MLGGELYHGDCQEIMPRIPAESVDLVLCDLPYGTTASAIRGGGGSKCVAAAIEGSEKDDKYYDIACARVAEAERQVRIDTEATRGVSLGQKGNRRGKGANR